MVSVIRRNLPEPVYCEIVDSSGGHPCKNNEVCPLDTFLSGLFIEKHGKRK